MTGIRGQHVGPGEATLAVVERYVHDLAPVLRALFVIDLLDHFVKRCEFDQFTRDTTLSVGGQTQSRVFAQVDQFARDAGWDDGLDLPSCKQSVAGLPGHQGAVDKDMAGRSWRIAGQCRHKSGVLFLLPLFHFDRGKTVVKELNYKSVKKRSLLVAAP